MNAAPSSSDEPLLVRMGVRYLRGFAKGKQKPVAADAIHLLNPDERRALKRIERGAIARAALAGALSSVTSAAVEVVITRPILGNHPRDATLGEQVRFYAILGAATVLASIVEILFLYWDGLRSVHRLAHEAGLDLFPEAESESSAVAIAMARAALELPNPIDELFGVNPRREASKLRLMFASLIYKAKVSLTNFVMKIVVRRSLGRAVVRSWLPFVAVPFTAAWNGIVSWTILREARIRAMGPSAASEMLDIVFAAHPAELGEDARACVVRAVASSIVRTEDLHPNLVALLAEVMRRANVRDDKIDDTKAFLARLAALRSDDQTCILRVLAIASIIDGRLTRNERRLLVEAKVACGRDASIGAVEHLRRAFVAGDPLDRSAITDVA